MSWKTCEQRSAVTDTEVLVRANQAGVFNGREGRDLGFRQAVGGRSTDVGQRPGAATRGR